MLERPTRDRMTVLRDLDTAQRRVASLEHTAHETTKRATAELCDKLLPSARANVARYAEELKRAPECAPTRAYAAPSCSTIRFAPLRWRQVVDDAWPVLDPEIAKGLTIPEFLVRR